MKKRFWKKAQAATEYAAVVALLTLAILPSVYLFYSYSHKTVQQIDTSQLSSLAAEIAAEAEKVYYSGPPTRLSFEARMPNTVRSASVVQDPVTKRYVLLFNVATSEGLSEASFPLNVPVNWTADTTATAPGIKKFLLEAYKKDGDTFVFVRTGERCGKSGTYDFSNDNFYTAADRTFLRWCLCSCAFTPNAMPVIEWKPGWFEKRIDFGNPYLPQGCAAADYNGDCVVDKEDWKTFCSFDAGFGCDPDSMQPCTNAVCYPKGAYGVGLLISQPSYPQQTRFFHDGTYYWAFYVDGSQPADNIFYSSSPDGIVWSAAQRIDADTYANYDSLKSVTFKNINGQKVVYVMWARDPNQKLSFKRGIISGNAISWQGAINTNVGVFTTNDLALDKDNYYWASYPDVSQVFRSTAADTGDPAWFPPAPYFSSQPPTQPWQGAPYTGMVNDMVALPFSTADRKVLLYGMLSQSQNIPPCPPCGGASLFGGANDKWATGKKVITSANNDIPSYFFSATGVCGVNNGYCYAVDYSFSAASKAYLAYARASNTDEIRVRVYSEGTDAWSDLALLNVNPAGPPAESYKNQYGGLALIEKDNKLYLIYVAKDENIYYYIYDLAPGSWGPRQTLMAEPFAKTHLSPIQPGSGRVAVSWFEQNGAVYDARVAIIPT